MRRERRARRLGSPVVTIGTVDRIESLLPIATKPAKTATPPASSAEPAPYREVITQLLNLWSLLVLCVGAFAAPLLTGVLAAFIPELGKA